jgi:hypothetical protein
VSRELNYFAYGSNMSSRRLTRRVKIINTIDPTCLKGYELTFNKLGKDSTAKANLVASPEGHLWGVLYRLVENEAQLLDGFEPAYVKLHVHARGMNIRDEASAFTYSSNLLTEDQKPARRYLEHIIEGAREHALPEDYISFLKNSAINED